MYDSASAEVIETEQLCDAIPCGNFYNTNRTQCKMLKLRITVDNRNVRIIRYIDSYDQNLR